MTEARAYLNRNPITDGYSYQYLMLRAFQVDNADLDPKFGMKNIANLIYTEANFTHTWGGNSKEEQLTQVKSNLIEAIDRMRLSASNILAEKAIEDARIRLSLASNSSEVMVQVWRLTSLVG